MFMCATGHQPGGVERTRDDPPGASAPSDLHAKSLAAVRGNPVLGVAMHLDHAVLHGATRPAQAPGPLADMRTFTGRDAGDERDRLIPLPSRSAPHARRRWRCPHWEHQASGHGVTRPPTVRETDSLVPGPRP